MIKMLSWDKPDQSQQDFAFGCGLVGFSDGGIIDFCALTSVGVCLGSGCASCEAGFVLPPQQPEPFAS
jgi:hypothetical protein